MFACTQDLTSRNHLFVCSLSCAYTDLYLIEPNMSISLQYTLVFFSVLSLSRSSQVCASDQSRRNLWDFQTVESMVKPDDRKADLTPKNRFRVLLFFARRKTPQVFIPRGFSTPLLYESTRPKLWSNSLARSDLFLLPWVLGLAIQWRFDHTRLQKAFVQTISMPYILRVYKRHKTLCEQSRPLWWNQKTLVSPYVSLHRYRIKLLFCTSKNRFTRSFIISASFWLSWTTIIRSFLSISANISLVDRKIEATTGNPAYDQPLPCCRECQVENLHRSSRRAQRTAILLTRHSVVRMWHL